MLEISRMLDIPDIFGRPREPVRAASRHVRSIQPTANPGSKTPDRLFQSSIDNSDCDATRRRSVPRHMCQALHKRRETKNQNDSIVVLPLSCHLTCIKTRHGGGG